MSAQGLGRSASIKAFSPSSEKGLHSNFPPQATLVDEKLIQRHLLLVGLPSMGTTMATFSLASSRGRDGGYGFNEGLMRDNVPSSPIIPICPLKITMQND